MTRRDEGSTSAHHRPFAAGTGLGTGGDVKVSGKPTIIAPVTLAGSGNGMPSIWTRRLSTAEERSSLGPFTLMTTGLSRGDSTPRPGTSPVFCSMIWYWTPALVDRSVI
jgi:hypothetical protein